MHARPVEAAVFDCRDEVTRLKLTGLKADKLKKVDTPFLDEGKEDDSEAGGDLRPYASKVLMKVLFWARMCRYDLLRAVCGLARKVTQWTFGCDKRLHRLMCYIHHSYEVRM
jgi:hypothetical protein